MLAVGLYRATRPVLSWDEVTTSDVARWTGAQLWALIQNDDAVFGPYYFFMHFWTSMVGDSVLDLRLPSIIMMAAAVGVTAELGRRLFSPLTGFVAGLMLCLLPNISRYAAEARPYAFACFLSVLAMLLLYRALEQPGVLRWTTYGLAVLGLGLSHIVALATLGAHVAVLALHLRATRKWTVAAGWATAVAGALLLLAPLALLGIRQQHQQISWIAPLTWETVRAAPADIAGTVETGWLIVGLALAAAGRPARRHAEIALLAAAPLIVVALVSVLATPLWVARYLLVVLPPVALLAAVATVGRPGLRRPLRAVRVGAVLVVLAFAALPGLTAVRGDYIKNGSDYRGAASIIESGQRPGDGIVYMANSRAQRAGIDYYLRGDTGRPGDLTLERPAAQVASLTAEEYPDAVPRVTGVSRVWLFVYGTHDDPTWARLDLRTLLQTGYRRAGLWHLSRATLALYVRGGAA
jgi:mannosyltransferase